MNASLGCTFTVVYLCTCVLVYLCTCALVYKEYAMKKHIQSQYSERQQPHQLRVLVLARAQTHALSHPYTTEGQLRAAAGTIASCIPSHDDTVRDFHTIIGAQLVIICAPPWFLLYSFFPHPHSESHQQRSCRRGKVLVKRFGRAVGQFMLPGVCVACCGPSVISSSIKIPSSLHSSSCCVRVPGIACVLFEYRRVQTFRFSFRVCF